MRSQLALLTVALIVAGCSERSNPVAPRVRGAKSEELSGDTDIIATPGGWYHADCVRQVPNGALVGATGLVHRPDGTTYQLSPCAHPGRVASRTSSGRFEAGAPLDSGWIEWAQYNTGQAWSEIDATWHVPAAPAALYSSTQVYFTFPGVEATYISQPVLAYGFAGGTSPYGGNFWTVAAWHCNSGSDCKHGPPITVSVGDSLVGTVSSSNCVSGSCTWTIVGKDVTKGTQSSFSIAGTNDLSVAVGGAVETYNLTACNQFPANGVFFKGIALYDQNHQLASPHWSPVVNPLASPNCTFIVDTTASTVTLVHNPTLTVSMTGSSNITSPGTYTWTASPSGGQSPYSYQWHIHYATGSDGDLGTGQSQSVVVTSGDDDFVIRVTVTSGIATGSTKKTVCVFGCG